VAAAFGLVALNGFFVATEFALVKVRPTRLDELARRGSAAARRAKRLVEHLDEYLSATQLGITLASLALGWIGEPAFAHLIEPWAPWQVLLQRPGGHRGGAVLPADHLPAHRLR